jgi:phospholipid/cholesterol/gamma-HCH transport system substrate-binding protein
VTRTRGLRSAVLTVVTVLLAASLAGCSREGFEVTTTFDDVGDLQARHSVQMADVRIGEIRSVRLTEDFRAEVRMTIHAGRRVPRHSVAVLRTTSLLGEKFVELRPKGDPAAGPFLADGDVLRESIEAPELEFVAQEAITVLGAVVSNDVASLIETGAEAFGGRGPELRALIEDLAAISASLASRTTEIQRIIDGLDATTAQLAGDADDLATLLTNLATTTQVLADNRERAVTALDQLSRLARVQNDILVDYRADIERQIGQVDAILAVAAGETVELGLLVDWLEKFVVGTPTVIPGDFAQVYGWFIPEPQDTRPDGPAGNRPGVDLE